jgi:hypothetical protein
MFAIHQYPLSRYVSIKFNLIENRHTSEPSPATVLAKVYPGNSIHCPTHGAPPSRARSRAARNRVFPVQETTAEVNSADILK